MLIDWYFVLILRVAAGTFAIQAPNAPLSMTRAMEYATAATYHGLSAGVDPFELIGIARNESDFQQHVRGPDGKDCGLTQTRITISKYSCRQLLRSYWLDFKEAAREMSEYARACKGKSDYDRCRLNHYNSGAHYARHGVHGAYWLRVTCFAEAARQGVVVGSACRHVRSKRGIVRILRKARTPQPMLAAAPSAPSS
jgi:hypothetical protein